MELKSSITQNLQTVLKVNKQRYEVITLFVLVSSVDVVRR